MNEWPFVWLFSFQYFVFLYFGHFTCVIFFRFVLDLNFCLTHIALLSKKVNKHHIMFWYFCNFVDQNEKQKMEWKAHLEHFPIHNPWFLCQSDLTNFNCCISKLPSHLFCTQGVPASKFPISIWTRIQGQHGCQIFRKIV